MPSIKLSQQTHEDFQKLKTIISQMLGKDEVDDDQVIASLVGGFLDSLGHEAKQYHPTQWCCSNGSNTNHQHKKEWCCGWTCAHKH
jgi:hypothetical protein